MTRQPVPAAQPPAIEGGRDQARMLADLVLRGATPEQVQLVLHVCRRYGFDPLLRHVVLINGQLYVTRDGLLDNAHRSGRLDGIEVEAVQDQHGKWLATATVWVRGMSHPVRYTAYQPEHESATSPAWKKAPRAMTVKCAEVMALKRAFNISLGTAEELGHEEAGPDPSLLRAALEQEPASAVVDADGVLVEDHAPASERVITPPSRQLPVTERQLRAIHARAREAGKSAEEMRAIIAERFGRSSSTQLTMGEASDLLDWLASELPPEEPEQPALPVQ